MTMDPGRAFYRPPYVIKTSAEIIKEARAEMATRPVNTKRPFTPIERQRKLFGPLKAGTSRPPSAFSLRQVEFQEVDSVKLPPLKATNSSARISGKQSPWRLPGLGLKLSSSLTNLPEETEAEPPIDVWPDDLVRETHSSPQERTEFSEPKKGKGHLPLSLSFPASQKNKNHLRKKYSQYRPLNSRNDSRSRLSSNYSIKETDENEDVQTLTLDNPDRSKQKLFKAPNIIPLSAKRSYLSSELDVTIEDNRRNEKKAVEAFPKPKDNEILTLVNEIDTLHERGANENELNNAISMLYLKLKAEGNNKIPSNEQSLIIKVLFKFVESATDLLLLYIAKVMLALKVNGVNLLAVTKLIFKVSRSDKNDSLFLEGDILELFVDSLGRASPVDDAEACIYGYGALKFLTMNQQLLLVALKLGILELMVLHLKIVNNARLDLLPIPEQTSHGMFQLTGALRNVASEETTSRHFVHTGAIGELCTSMELFSADLDLISNIARTISILSTHDECCESIINHENCFRSITKILNKYPGRQDIIVRFGYALGNIITKSDDARIKLYQEPGAMSSILNLLENYLDKDLEIMRASGPYGEGIKSPDWASDGSVEDVIVKMIRIVANMSMHPEVGTGMTCAPPEDMEDPTYPVKRHNARDGGKFLDILLMILRRKSVTESEELVMSALSTLNNLSFYSDPQASTEGPFTMRQIEITQVLSTLLLTKNEDSMIEVTRVLGNLSRSKDVRDYILEIGGISQLVRCLEHDNKELLFTTTGVLVNLMADWDKRLAFKENNGVHKLIMVLKKTSDGDWRLASLVCQAIWNFCIDSTHLYAALGVQATNNLLTVLVDLLDEEKLFGIVEGSEAPDYITESCEYRLWEQFANVATNLLEKIEQYLESLQVFDT
ncbi:unnamed protein product [Nezara viridula]|uniref:Armadillo repeat-containing protein 2 n=1 Tax=Nezara viridula TaxID=85310 RepID=A0A9P0HIR2_NEZVI|nr:unnamed protein product [Nezara viridula]